MIKKIISETEINLDDHPELKEFYERFSDSGEEYVISVDVSTSKDMSASVAFIKNEYGKYVFDSIHYFK